jgi:hypothetical protein
MNNSKAQTTAQRLTSFTVEFLEQTIAESKEYLAGVEAKQKLIEAAELAIQIKQTEQLIKNCEANPFIDDQTIEALKASIA